MRCDMACNCVVGKVRTNNEDNFYFNGFCLNRENQGLTGVLTCEKPLKRAVYCGVFDGMGGEAHGEVAAYETAKTFRRFIRREWIRSFTLEQACIEANRKVCAAARKLSAGMIGATVAVIRFAEDIAQIVNVGDSKIFLLRNGELSQVSQDHTDKAFLEAQGITKRKPRLTQHMGIEPTEMVIEPYRMDIALCPGDRFLVCSDGLTDMVPMEALQEVLARSASVKQAVEELVRMAMDAGGKDNITVICCTIGK